jgi:hypothetical protein
VIVRRVLAAVVIALAAVGCGDGGADRATSESDQVTYALLRDDGWTLQEAADLPDGASATGAGPPIDWYDEYVSWPSERESQLVTIAGHEATFEDTSAELERIGFDLQPVDVRGWRAVGSDGGSDDDDPTAPTMLVLQQGERSLSVQSYEVRLSELASIAANIDSVDAPTWMDARGREATPG